MRIQEYGLFAGSKGQRIMLPKKSRILGVRPAENDGLSIGYVIVLEPEDIYGGKKDERLIFTEYTDADITPYASYIGTVVASGVSFHVFEAEL